MSAYRKVREAAFLQASKVLTRGSALKADHLVKVYVGDEGAPPFLLQQTLLTSISPVFANALKHENLGTNPEPGVLRFPEDDTEAWEVFLHWLMQRSYPQDLDARSSVKCWVLGDRYHISTFQDNAMFALLVRLDNKWAKLDDISYAFRLTPPGSKLRLLMAEELVMLMDDKKVVYDEIDCALNGTNFVGELLRARDRLAAEDRVCEGSDEDLEHEWSMRDRFGRTDEEAEVSWQEFMVGNGGVRFTGVAKEHARRKS